MSEEIERNLGTQPLLAVMQAHEVNAQDLVSASPSQLTHKMIARACKGRRLTKNTKAKVRLALQAATGKEFPFHELFNY